MTLGTTFFPPTGVGRLWACNTFYLYVRIADNASEAALHEESETRRGRASCSIDDCEIDLRDFLRMGERRRQRCLARCNNARLSDDTVSVTEACAGLCRNRLSTTDRNNTALSGTVHELLTFIFILILCLARLYRAMRDMCRRPNLSK